MPKQFQNEWTEILGQVGTLALIAANDANGDPHATVTDNLHLDAEGRLVYLEYLESSQINKNLVRSLWFKKKISISILTHGTARYQLKGIPTHAIISGPVFESYYRSVSKKTTDTDLSTVWLIDVLEVSDERWESRKKDQDENHGIVAHLDRFAL